MEKYRSLLWELSNMRSPDETIRTDKDGFMNVKSPEKELLMYEQYLKANESCLQELTAHESKIYQVIAKLKSRCEQIDKDAERNKKTRPGRRIGCVYSFGSPFFKDESYFSAFPNDITLEKKMKKEINITDLLPVRSWKRTEKEKLINAIRRIVSAKRIEQYKQKKVCIEELILESNNDNRIKYLEEELEKCDEMLESIPNLPLKVLISQPNRNAEYDWMRISATDLHGEHTPEECRAIWFAYLSPFINKTKFTADEDRRLKEIAHTFRCENWDGIAETLGTGRSAYQCAVRFHMKLNTLVKKRKWTLEEDKKLIQIVNMLRVGSYIPWAKVVSHMEGRTKVQVFNRYKYSIGPHIKKGRFTHQEDKMIMIAIHKYGPNFKQIARFVPNRTPIQIRDRYISHLKRTDPSEPWKPENDIKLISLVEEQGVKAWSKISKEFPGFSRTQIRHRFLTIQKWKLKHPALMNRAPPVRRMTRRGVSQLVDTTVFIDNLKNPSDEDLVKVQETLGLTYKTKVGRKSGQKKVMSLIDQKLMSHFRVVHHHIGGRRKKIFFQEDVENECKILELVLKFFNASLIIPSNVFEANEFEEDDKYFLQYLKDGHLKEDPSLRKKMLDTSKGLSLKENADPTSFQSFTHDTKDDSPSTECPVKMCDVLEECRKVTSTQDTYACANNIVPVNITTLIGMHTLTLCRKALAKQYKHWKILNHEKWAEVSSDSSDSDDPEDLTVEELPEVNSEMELWMKRFLSLFLGPVWMTNVSPQSNLLLGLNKSVIEVESEYGSHSYDIFLNEQSRRTPRTPRRYYKLKRKRRRKRRLSEQKPEKIPIVATQGPKRKFKKYGSMPEAMLRRSPRFTPNKVEYMANTQAISPDQ